MAIDNELSCPITHITDSQFILNICLTFHNINLSIQISDFNGSDWLFVMNMWLYGFFLKLLPCVVLTLFTACLIHAMYQVRREKHLLKSLVIIMMPIFCRLKRNLPS